jgi:hypothetical protein
MSSALIEHNRRAVYSALSAVCSERSLLEQAFFFWEEHYSQQGAFRVSQYIDALMQHIGLNQAQRRELSVALYAAMGKPDQALAVVPAVLRRNQAAASTAAPPAVQAAHAARPRPQSAAATVLGELLAQLVDGATRARKLEDLLEILNFAGFELSPGSTRAAAQWLVSGLRDARSFAAQVAAGDRRCVVNAVYMALCEAVGPVDADRILGQATQRAEHLPEAIQFSPRELL